MSFGDQIFSILQSIEWSIFLQILFIMPKRHSYCEFFFHFLHFFYILKEIYSDSSSKTVPRRLISDTIQEQGEHKHTMSMKLEVDEKCYDR